MHFCENILKHLALMQEMGKAHMPDSLLKDYKEEELLEVSQSINQMDAGSLVAALDKEAVEYLIREQPKRMRCLSGNGHISGCPAVAVPGA